ncbi:MAG TPA: histidinol dehydrogenase [Syntrophorhabdaceae bacterium]|mgnify:FL=1|jgi:histidinol dehydrogenase|nr:histidinol dehydrogenase [Syntrophorhabdaceae bacterium]OQC47750.1 MAG: Histidinol dehydrogenase [Deltaproteobacteria bacterium ADurb.Bin026]MBP8697792.1 histidinol dehydrogenase [Syntrophorhabdaceae bacterium]MBV6505763.1 Histidinol dehydrogenase [Syntrophorhabdaceae bacterium]HPH42147.1 histidinol dehydrogenase [Syntrophorhabdaceae bacterium]
MKIWDLEKEHDKLLSSILEGREKKKKNIKTVVEAVKHEILARGETALIEFSKKWDGWKQDYNLKVSEEELTESASKVKKKDRDILRGMMKNVLLYHKSQGGRPRTYTRKGLNIKETFVPVESTMVYVPGGKAAYPSSLIMGVVPAKVAGVNRICVATPTADGMLNPYVAAACVLLDIKEVYRIGGAQAVYAFAYGVGCIPKVDMIVGPGNAYVDEAKRDVYGMVGIDMLAGPTELVVLCTYKFSPDIIAWDMFSQGEHDEMATVGLFSPSKEHIYDVMKSIERLIITNERKDVIEKALRENSFLVYYEDIEKAVKTINSIAPEHMELIGDEGVSEKVLYPGIVYLGAHTPVAMGDYYIGTNHVLPTGGAGRFTAGLSVDRFTKRKVVVKIDEQFLNKYGDKAVKMARIEGLYAHGESIKARKGL